MHTHCSKILQHAATRCKTLQHTAERRGMCTATYCSTLHHTTTHCRVLRHERCSNIPQNRATHCNALQRAATHCNTSRASRHGHCNKIPGSGPIIFLGVCGREHARARVVVQNHAQVGGVSVWVASRSRMKSRVSVSVTLKVSVSIIVYCCVFGAHGIISYHVIPYHICHMTISFLCNQLSFPLPPPPSPLSLGIFRVWPAGQLSASKIENQKGNFLL